MADASTRTSFESHEKQELYGSGAPSEAGDVEAHDGGLARRTQTRSTIEGAPLEHTYSHLSVPAQPGIPDGGFTAWLQVTCGFFLFFNSW